MLTFADAHNIVQSSVRKLANRSALDTADTLASLGIDSESAFHVLIHTIAFDPDSGASSFAAKVDVADLAALSVRATIKSLVDTLQLSARKLCSNPVNPHEQPCCPYPQICGECGADVI
jgi:hypothetical protein